MATESAPITMPSTTDGLMEGGLSIKVHSYGEQGQSTGEFIRQSKT